MRPLSRRPALARVLWLATATTATACALEPSPPARGIAQTKAALAWTASQRLVDPSASRFGASVATDGDTAIVSAKDMAYLFTRDGGGTWSQQGSPLTQSGMTGNALVVALSGDLALVGSRATSTGNLANHGAAFAFHRDGVTWSWEATLTAPAPTAKAYLGEAVALDGNTALAGSRLEDVGLPQAGAAYIFERDPSGPSWSPGQQLLADDATGQTKLVLRERSSHEPVATIPDIGPSWLLPAVAIDGDLALVSSASNGGTVYVFERGTCGAPAEWCPSTPSTLPVPPSAGAGAEFGSALALEGERALVGAWLQNATVDNQGAVYVFERQPDGSWTVEAELVEATPWPGARFGNAVALDGDRALVGAWLDPGTNTDTQFSGAAFAFHRGVEGGWTEVDQLLAPTEQAEALFGAAVALTDGSALVGAFGELENGVATGAVHVFEASPGAPCASSGECGTLACVDGRCCSSPCDGPCEACGADGLCVPTPAGSLDPACPDTACDGQGACALRAGEACTTASQCVTGHCVDGVCCTSACEGTCEACQLSETGICAPIPAGEDPDGECGDLVCDGSRACGASKIANGAACGEAASCESGFCVDDLCCAVADCSPYRCGQGGICPLTCQDDDACTRGHHCVDGACVEVGGCQLSAGSSAPRAAWPWWVGLALVFARRRATSRRMR